LDPEEMFDHAIENKIRDTMHEMIAEYTVKWDQELDEFEKMKKDLRGQKLKFTHIDRINKELPHLYSKLSSLDD